MPEFSLQTEPANFDEKCRKAGNAWLAANPDADRPRDYWSAFRPNLSAGFRGLCGYSFLIEHKGSVDHFEPCNPNKHLAYEWNNYRFCNTAVNSSKCNRGGFYDPFEIEFEWFRIHLPSMVMIVSQDAPPSKRSILSDTLNRLPIGSHPDAINFRAVFYDAYKRGDMLIGALRSFAPVLALSVEEHEREHPGEPLP
jgi:hypothetical protein